VSTFRARLDFMLREQAWRFNAIIDRIKLRLSIVERVAGLQSEGVL